MCLARATAWVRRSTPSLSLIWRAWLFTVCSEMNSRSLISWLDNPWAISSSTASSRPLSTSPALPAGSAGGFDLVEINEAFASQSIACIRELGLDMDRINLDGGALAIGHPLGATGARITGKAAALLRRTGGRYAIATQCIAGGQGVATLLEAVE